MNPSKASLTTGPCPLGARGRDGEADVMTKATPTLAQEKGLLWGAVPKPEQAPGSDASTAPHHTSSVNTGDR